MPMPSRAVRRDGGQTAAGRTPEMARLRIGGREVRPGAVERIFLTVSEHYTATPVKVPVTVIRGRRRGPVLFLTAAVHGDELNGVEAVRRIMTATPADDLRGTLICVPVV